MKTFKIFASRLVHAEIEIQANDIREAHAIARKSRQTLFSNTASVPEWEIDHISEMQTCETIN